MLNLRLLVIGVTFLVMGIEPAMSDVFHDVTLPDTGDVIRVRWWNEGFVDNWNYVSEMTVGEMSLANLSGLEIGQSMVWIDGAELVGVDPSIHFDITLPANATHLRLIVTGLRLEKNIYGGVAVIFNGDYTAANYQQARYWTGSGNTNEYFGGSAIAGVYLCDVPGDTNSDTAIGNAQMTIYNAGKSGSYDTKHFESKYWSAGTTSLDLEHGFTWGQWTGTAAITSLTFTTYDDAAAIISNPNYGPIRIDIYALMHG